MTEQPEIADREQMAEVIRRFINDEIGKCHPDLPRKIAGISLEYLLQTGVIKMFTGKTTPEEAEEGNKKLHDPDSPYMILPNLLAGENDFAEEVRNYPHVWEVPLFGRSPYSEHASD